MDFEGVLIQNSEKRSHSVLSMFEGVIIGLTSHNKSRKATQLSLSKMSSGFLLRIFEWRNGVIAERMKYAFHVSVVKDGEVEV